MMSSVPLREASLDELSLGCAQEIENFHRQVERAAGYCFEIFRRAIADPQGDAWAVFVGRCQQQVGRWAQRHPGFARCGEDLEDITSDAFRKMWQSFATDTDKIARFANFPALMLYLKMCVNSAIVDLLRHPAGDELPDDHPVFDAPASDSRAMWEFIAARLKDDQERLVIRAFFLYDLTPRDILRQFPNRFSGIAEIYRIKQNVVARLRRDNEFRDRFGEGD
jgi:hypothetical protein